MSPKATETRPEEPERRRTILRAAVDVFAKKGYHGCRIADVAQEAGVAYGLVYHYFKNKEQLLEAVFETAWGGFVNRVREVAESDAPLAEQVRGICEVAFEAYHVDPRGVRVVILEIARSPAGSHINRDTAFSEVIRLGSHMFTRGRERGELRADLDPRLCAAMLFGSLEMSLTAFVAGFMKGEDRDEVIQSAKVQLAEVFLRGVLSEGSLATAAATPKLARRR